MQTNIHSWWIYIIQCSDESLYTGITKNLEKRFLQHKNKKGAKYFYAREPIKIVYQESAVDRSEATKREISIKKMTRIKKIELIKNALSVE